MNQNPTVIRLRDYMERSDGWGKDEGRAVYSKLIEVIDRMPGTIVFHISLNGVERSDVSFARESVMELAVRYKGRRGFCLTNVASKDLLENLDSAALRKKQPMTVAEENDHYIIGLQPSRGNKALFDFVLKYGETSASEVAEALELKLTNASTKLKQLLESGFILRRDEKAPSGGVEFRYFAIS